MISKSMMILKECETSMLEEQSQLKKSRSLRKMTAKKKEPALQDVLEMMEDQARVGSQITTKT